jgi:hypothetical protein
MTTAYASSVAAGACAPPREAWWPGREAAGEAFAGVPGVTDDGFRVARLPGSKPSGTDEVEGRV